MADKLKFGKPAEVPAPKFEPARVDAPLSESTQSTEDGIAKLGLIREEDHRGKKVVYSCHPIHKLSLGDYRFVNTRLELEPEEVEDFEKLLNAQPPWLKIQVKKLDVLAANQLVKDHLRGRTVSGIDTTANSFGPNGNQQA